MTELLPNENKKEFKEKFKIITTNIRDIIIESDANGKFTYVSPKVYDILGYKPEELIGLDGNNLIHPDDLNSLDKNTKSIIKHGNTISSKYRALHKEGHFVSLLAKGTAVRDNERTKVITILQDLSHKSPLDDNLRFITDNVNDIISVFDENFQLLYINEAQERFSGFSIEEVRGKSPFEFLHPDDIKIARKAFKNTLKNGEGRGQFRTRTKKNEYKWMEVNGRVNHNLQGKKRILLVSRDITKQKEIEQKLIESEETYRSLITNLTDIILEAESSGRVTYISPQCYEIIGYKPSEIIGKNAFEFIHPKDILTIAETMKNALKTRELLSVLEYRLVHKNGNIVYVSAKGKFVKANGKDKFIVNIRDISREKEIESKLKEAEKNYELFSKNINDIIWTMDLNFKTNYVSPSVKKIFGFTEEEHLARMMNEKFTQESLNKINLMIREYITPKNINDKNFNPLFRIEVDQYHKNGSIIPCEVTVNPVRDEDGVAFGLVGITRDITKRKKAEQQLKESEEKYRTLFENSPHAIGLVNSKGIVVQCNSNVEKIFGYKLEEIIGKKFNEFSLFSKEHNAIVLNRFKKLVKGDVPEPQELLLNRKDGGKIWISMQVSLVQLKNETLFQVITQDISKIKKVEMRLEEQNQELEQLNDLKTEFLRRASHELKTPLIAIKGNADLMLKENIDKLKPDVANKLGEIQIGCRRLDEIVYKLIESSRLESSKIKLHTSKEDLASLIKHSVKELKTLAKMRSITINNKVNNPLITNINKDQIHEVISNLLCNAINYSPRREIIDINAEFKENDILISIKDSGIGFTEEEKNQIFQKFGKIKRIASGYDNISEGSGLGLYISKQIVELHGGEIWVESEGRNKGSTFYFTLPRKKA